MRASDAPLIAAAAAEHRHALYGLVRAHWSLLCTHDGSLPGARARRPNHRCIGMGRAPNRRDLGPQPGPDQPSSYSAGKIQSRKAPAPAHGKKPLQEPITAIAHKVTGFGAQQPYAYHPHTPAYRRPPAPQTHTARRSHGRQAVFWGGGDDVSCAAGHDAPAPLMAREHALASPHRSPPPCLTRRARSSVVRACAIFF